MVIYCHQLSFSLICGGAPHQIQPHFCLIPTKKPRKNFFVALGVHFHPCTPWLRLWLMIMMIMMMMMMTMMFYGNRAAYTICPRTNWTLQSLYTDKVTQKHSYHGRLKLKKFRNSLIPYCLNYYHQHSCCESCRPTTYKLLSRTIGFRH